MQMPRRQAFTLIELLVVMAIILILLGISFGVYLEVTRHQAENRTNEAMERAMTLYDGYKAAEPKMTALNALIYPSGIPAPKGPNNQLDVPGPSNPTSPPGLSAKTLLDSQLDLDQTYGYLRACRGPNHVHDWPTIEANDDQYQSTLRAIDFTQQVMRVLLTVPANRDIINQLPAEAKYYITDKAGNNIDPPLLADGYGEPIYFVPKEGLGMSGIGQTATTSLSAITGINYPNATTNWPTVMQSDGRPHIVPASTDLTPPANPQPFWVSAGPDDDLGAALPNAGVLIPAQSTPISGKGGAGDDNVYSFGK